jgi:hypothetical protein
MTLAELVKATGMPREQVLSVYKDLGSLKDTAEYFGITVLGGPMAEPKAAKAAPKPAKVAPKAAISPVEAFVLKAIPYLAAANGSKSRGVHTRISGLNSMIRHQFGIDPVALQKAMVAKGLVEGHPAKMGYMLYLRGQMPTQRSEKDLTSLAAEILKSGV